VKAKFSGLFHFPEIPFIRPYVGWGYLHFRLYSCKMIGQKQFNLTEWDWFKLQIRLQALELGGKLFVMRYNFPEPGDRTRESRICSRRRPLELNTWNFTKRGFSLRNESCAKFSGTFRHFQRR
jgi:hypothetical protein